MKDLILNFKILQLLKWVIETLLAKYMNKYIANFLITLINELF